MADVSHETTFSWGATAVGKITNLSGPSIHHEALDITDLDSSAKEFIAAGVYDPGEITLDINIEPDLAIHDQLRADCQSGTTRAMIINYVPLTITYSSDAYITDFAPTAAVEDKLTCSVTVKLSGTLTKT